MKMIITMILGIVLSAAGMSFAQQPPSTSASTEQLTQVNNKICPVSGEKVARMGPAIKYVYNGKVYNLCCPMCKKDFKNNPEKYSKIAQDEVKKEK